MCNDIIVVAIDFDSIGQMTLTIPDAYDFDLFGKALVINGQNALSLFWNICLSKCVPKKAEIDTNIKEGLLKRAVILINCSPNEKEK